MHLSDQVTSEDRYSRWASGWETLAEDLALLLGDAEQPNQVVNGGLP